MERKSLLAKSLDALKNLAARLKVIGRSRMSKEELAEAISKASQKASDRLVEAVGGKKPAKAATKGRTPERDKRKSDDDEAEESPRGKRPAVKPARREAAAPVRKSSATPARGQAQAAAAAVNAKAAPSSKSARPAAPASKPSAEPAATGMAAFAPPIPELPATYGSDRITLLARDPSWLFTYWEATVASRERARSQLNDPKARLTLRVYDVTDVSFDGHNANRTHDIQVPDQTTGNWYVNVWSADAQYVVDIGYLAADGRFVTVARSNMVRTPRATLSDRVDQAWMTVESDYAKIFQLQGRGPHHLSSLQIREMLAKKIEQQLSSPTVTSFSSPAQAPGGERPEPHDFWLQVRTELIVYGATDPSATVQVCGQKIDLRPDGTFSLRFALPDGKQEIPVHARSVRREERTIVPVVDKRTH